MTSQVFWIVEGVVREGEREAFGALIDEMVASTQDNEPGTMGYEWFLDPAGNECRIVETYRNSSAAMIHLHTFEEKYARRLEQVMQIQRLTLYGNAEKELVDALGGDGTTHFAPVSGFVR
jgi:quinol monooxygenase YgiN